MHHRQVDWYGASASVLVAALLTMGCDVGVPSLDELLADARVEPWGDSSSEDDLGGGIRCGSGEVESPGPVCTARERNAASFRFVTSPGTMGTLQCSASARGPWYSQDESQPASSHHVVVTGLEPSQPYSCAYGVIQGGEAGQVAWTVSIEALEARMGPIITEVLIDPLGTEPAQEFVEILNPGPGPLDLSGFRLMDQDPAGLPDPLEEGDELPHGQILADGQLALLVPTSFSTTGPDPTPDEDALLIRLDGSLARSGLRNSGGEPVFLVDPDGHAVSSYDNVLGSTSPGSSAQRIDPEAPGGDPENWMEGLPTPGR